MITRTLASPPLAPAEDLRLKPAGTRLLDASGREVILRGVNVGTRSKLAPFFPFAFAESGLPDQKDAPPFDQACAQFLDGITRLGFNFIRLPLFWEAVEPQRGQYDAAYLSRLARMVDLAADRHLRVQLDSHQDLFTRAYGGDGFPAWASSAPQSTEPWFSKVIWGSGYSLNSNVRRDFTRLWQNQDGLRDAYTAMWQTVAARLANKTNLVGFEIINEPNQGNIDEKTWASRDLPDFERRVGRAIHQVAPDVPLIFGGSNGDGLRSKTDTRRPDDGPWIFAPHHYDEARTGLALLKISGAEVVLPPSRPEQSLKAWAQLGQQWNVPVIIGEFGIPTHSLGAGAQMAHTYDALDDNLLSGAEWEYSTAGPDWNHEGMSIVGEGGVATRLSAVATRAYPAAVAGHLLAYHWDAFARHGQMTLTADKDGTSEVALPASLLGNGQINLRASNGDIDWRYDAQHGRLYVTCHQPGRTVIDFSVRPTKDGR